VPVYRLDHRLVFPDPELATDEGILAIGGDLRPERLLLAYSMGIFPWYEEGLPILWHSPDPRMVLPIGKLHVPRSLEKTLRRDTYEIRFDTAFAEVITACGARRRPGQHGTWITEDMKRAYVELHRLGWAHSAEAWAGGKLVGGVYGVSMGAIFFGESMFADAPDASKAAFVVLARHLAERGTTLIDCQVHTDHLERFGAEEWPRRRYLDALPALLARPTRKGSWTR
jgi:leucyl/phenylalanyl-tRNA--protein transferase